MTLIHDATTPTFAQAADEFSHDAFTSLFAESGCSSNDDEPPPTSTEPLKVAPSPPQDAAEAFLLAMPASFASAFALHAKRPLACYEIYCY